MNKDELKGNKSGFNNKVLQALLEDPTRSMREIAKELKSYRQRIWRIKRKLEEEHVIWGYTAIIDENKLNHMSYVMLLKMKPMNKELADLALKRLLRNAQQKQNIRLINFCIVNGEYDWILRFSAPDTATAKRYYDTIRLLYNEYLLEKPVMVDVDFCLVAEGKRNPEIKRLRDFVVSADE
jgi:DNA-binding Lrp family transcriptional regulator